MFLLFIFHESFFQKSENQMSTIIPLSSSNKGYYSLTDPEFYPIIYIVVH